MGPWAHLSKETNKQPFCPPGRRALAAVATGSKIKLGIGGVADKPTVREWEMLDGSALDDALNEFAWDLGGYDDIHATARYRRELVRRLGKRVIEEAKSCRN